MSHYLSRNGPNRWGRTPGHNPPRHPDVTAFTLLELLAVVAIIALLASILYPVLAQSRRSAVRASCQGRLRQIGLAFGLYTVDYDDIYPAAIDRYTRDRPESLPDDHPPISEMPDLVDVLKPYVGGEDTLVMRCPADKEPYQVYIDEVPTNNYPSAFAYAHTSYHFIYQNYFASPSSEANPAAVLCIDARPIWHGPGGRPGGFFEKTFNALFPDGRVKFASVSEMGH